MPDDERAVILLRIFDAFGNHQELAVFGRDGYCEAALSLMNASGYTERKLTLRILAGTEFAQLIVNELLALNADKIGGRDLASPLCLDGEAIRIFVDKTLGASLDFTLVNPDELADSQIQQMCRMLRGKIFTEAWVQKSASASRQRFLEARVMRDVAFLTNDLMFSSQVLGAAAKLGLKLLLAANSSDAAAKLTGDCRLVLVDLTLPALDLPAVVSGSARTSAGSADRGVRPACR